MKAENAAWDDTRVLFEIGFDQAEDIIEIMKENNFKDIKVFNDYCSTPRCVLGKT